MTTINAVRSIAGLHQRSPRIAGRACLRVSALNAPAGCGADDSLHRNPTESRMTFDERDEGDYRIYGGALEAAQGDGYIAALVVKRVRNTRQAPHEVFRDDALACGHRWASADAAILYAMGKGREVVQTERHRLAR